MRDSQDTIITESQEVTARAETRGLFPGAVVGFTAWLLVLGSSFLIYGSNTLFFFLYTWPFFLALMPVAVLTGIALHSWLNARLFFSSIATLLVVALLFGMLFRWLMG